MAVVQGCKSPTVPVWSQPRPDADLAAQVLAGMESMDQALRDSGHYGPRVPVAADASVQTRLLAFTGRQV